MATSYDEIPYHSFPFSQTHPIRLATIGRLFGMQTPPVNECRVLELGCAGAGNLLPMAESFPQSTFVGIDASAREIDDGRAAIAATGITNVDLQHMNILEIDEALGSFDYIIVHGVYSWVPSDVQARIFQLCRKLLAENGIAYISYNTLPGWHLRGMVRDVMCYRAKFFQKPEDRLHEARELVNFLAASVRKEGNAYGLLLNDELRLLQEKEDYYLLHEFLEDINQPCYFHEFMEKAAAQGLQYLGEADFSVMSLANFSREVMIRLQELSSDVIQTEQYMDFVRNRMFRQTLLCRKELTLDRSLKAERVFDLYVSSSAEPESTLANINSRDRVTFRKPGSTLTSTEPLVKAAMVVLREHWPLSVHFPELLDRARARLNADPLVVESDRDRKDMYTLAEPLLRCFATTHVELAVAPVAPQLQPAELPCTTSLARYQATRGNIITNLWHKTITANDLQRHLIQHLDGKHDRPALIDVLAAQVECGKLVLRHHGQAIKDAERIKQILSEMLEPNLQDIARKGVLIPAPNV
jgi:methyltransferase-like protein/SAM-dependent methyltransferase